jgi:TonB family protein
MREARPLVPLLLVFALAVVAPLQAQEEPVTAGTEGVPVPKKTKHVQPVYPQEALAQGIRGIVILDIVVDAQGKVESTSVVRSVPGLDEAAITAARQWEYAPTKVDGKLVRVRVTVPITFALALPKLARQDGVPELRQGASPAWPAGASGGGVAKAELTLEPDGRVGVARILEGGAPWSDALLTALRTWRFAPPPEDEVLSFRVEAEFVSGGGSDAQKKVNLQATGLQRSGLLGEPSPAAAPAKAAAPAATAPAPPTAAAPQPRTTPPVAPPTPQTAPPASPTAPPNPQTAPPATPQAPGQAPGPVPPAPAPAPSAPGLPAPPASPAHAAPTGTSPAPGESRPTAPAGAEGPKAAPTAGAAAPPPVEVITAPPPSLPPENGVSAIRDVTLEPGVPDLTRGRRPVAPPLARMSGTNGSVEVAFSVSAAGTTTLQGATGPDLLRPAAEQAVTSWVFRRTRADRAYLVAAFAYAEDKSTAVVRPQAAPPPGAAAAPLAAAPVPPAPVPPAPAPATPAPATPPPPDARPTPPHP